LQEIAAGAFWIVRPVSAVGRACALILPGAGPKAGGGKGEPVYLCYNQRFVPNSTGS